MSQCKQSICRCKWWHTDSCLFTESIIRRWWISHLLSVTHTRTTRYSEDECCASGFSQIHFFTESKTMWHVCCWFSQRETASFVREHLLSVALTFKVISGSVSCWSATTFCWVERVCKCETDLLVWSSKPFSSFYQIFFICLASWPNTTWQHQQNSKTPAAICKRSCAFSHFAGFIY